MDDVRTTNDDAVVDHVDARRYELHLDGAVAGFADYRDLDGIRTFPHTVIDPAFRGRGLGDRLVSAALDDTIAQGYRINAICWFGAEHVQGRAAYADPLA